jgi:hypothetical protein
MNEIYVIGERNCYDDESIVGYVTTVEDAEFQVNHLTQNAPVCKSKKCGRKSSFWYYKIKLLVKP